MNKDDIDFDELIEAAQRMGYDTPERVIDRLWRIIVRNKQYLDYRSRSGRTGAYNETVAEDAVALAAAIKLLKRNYH